MRSPAAFIICLSLFVSGAALPAMAGAKEDAAALENALPRAFNPWNRVKRNVVVSGDKGYAYVHFQRPDKSEIRVVLGAGTMTLKKVMEIAARDVTNAKFIRGTWTSPTSGRKVRLAILYPAGLEKDARSYLRGIQWKSADKIADLPKE